MIQFEKFKLDNGLTVIVHEDDSTSMVCLNILYDIGARDEDENKTGFAHLFEHLMFGGSINIPNYDEPLQKVGGENNAFTTNDITNYYCTVPSENLETAFWLESDRMLSLAFSKKSLDVQRNVVIEEFKQRYLNQPYGDVWLHLRPLAYQKHPYKWSTIGKDIAHIEQATMADVKAFFKAHYHPSNAILVVAGKVKLETVKQMSQKWFGDIVSQPKIKRNLPKEPLQTEKRTLTLKRNVPANAIYKCFHICDRYHEDYHAIDLLSDMLSRGNSSRLYKSLVKEKALFSDINAYVTGDFDNGLLVFSGKLNDGVSMESAESAIDIEIQKITHDLLSEDELTKVKNKVESSLVFSEVDVLTKATNLAISELLGDADLVNQEIVKYNAVTTDKVKAVANLYLKETNANVLYYLKMNLNNE
jgi:zinc protease